MVKTLKGFNKVMGTTFTKVINGETLTEKQQKQMDNFIKDLGGYREMEQLKQEQPKSEEKELTLTNWMELTEEQQSTLKESLLKSSYGIGGEHFSSFPTLLDNKINTWVEQTYNISKLPNRVQEQTFKTWKENGELKILPIIKSNKVYYLTILLPNKEMEMDIYQLEKADTKPYLQYTTHNSLGTVKMGGNNFHILNGYTNKNKAYNQGKALVKLLNLGTDFPTLEKQKELQTNHLELIINNGEWVLQENGGNTGKATGNTYNNIGDYLGRTQHKDIHTNYMELLQTI